MIVLISHHDDSENNCHLNHHKDGRHLVDAADVVVAVAAADGAVAVFDTTRNSRHVVVDLGFHSDVQELPRLMTVGYLLRPPLQQLSFFLETFFLHLKLDHCHCLGIHCPALVEVPKLTEWYEGFALEW